MGRNKALGRVQRPERKEHVRVGSQAGVMVVTRRWRQEGTGGQEGRKTGGRGRGAKALSPKGLLVPGGGCYCGAVPALQRCGRPAILAGSPSGNSTSQPSWASPRPQAGLLEPRPAATAQTPFFAGSGSVIRVWSPVGLHLLPGAARQAGGAGACRPAKLRHPRELGFGFRSEPSGIQASGKGPPAISKKNAAGIFSASPKLQGLSLSLEAGLRFPGQRQVRPSKHALGPVV